MSEDEAIEILKIELENTKKANECGLATKGEFDKQIQAVETILAELEKKDKIINAMALQLSGISIWNDQKEEPLILMTEEEVKQYFERKAEDE